MEKAGTVCQDVDDQFRRVLGRGYGLVQSYECDDAEIILLAAGTIASSCRVVADRFAKKGVKVGVLRIRLFRPLPKEPICHALKNRTKVAVIDRDFSPGCGGILAQEVKAIFHNTNWKVPIYEFIAGLGGRDVTDEDIERIIEQTLEAKDPGEITWIGLLK